MNRFSYINIREYLVQDDMKEIGEAELIVAISDFSCPKNPANFRNIVSEI